MTAALIAAAVALLISGVGGCYAIVRSRTELARLQRQWASEVLTRAAAGDFYARLRSFQEKCDEFHSTYNRLAGQPDGTEAVQYVVDFYDEWVLPLLEGFPDFVPDDVKEAGAAAKQAARLVEERFRPNDASRLKYAHELVRAVVKVVKLLENLRARSRGIAESGGSAS